METVSMQKRSGVNMKHRHHSTWIFLALIMALVIPVCLQVRAAVVLDDGTSMLFLNPVARDTTTPVEPGVNAGDARLLWTMSG